MRLKKAKQSKAWYEVKSANFLDLSKDGLDEQIQEESKDDDNTPQQLQIELAEAKAQQKELEEQLALMQKKCLVHCDEIAKLNETLNQKDLTIKNLKESQADHEQTVDKLVKSCEEADRKSISASEDHQKLQLELLDKQAEITALESKVRDQEERNEEVNGFKEQYRQCFD